MIRWSLRRRLAVVYGGLLFVVLTLLGFGVVALLRYRLTEHFDKTLDTTLAGAEAFLRRETTVATADTIPLELEEYASTQTNGRFIEVRNADGRVVLAGQAATQPARARTRSFTLYGHAYQTKVSGSLGAIEDSVSEIERLFLWSIPLLLLAIGVTGHWISHNALRAVGDMTEAAQRIGAASLGERLIVPKSDDELSRLAAAWNEMLERLDDSFSRMRRFTADAAHEFRTPLTGLRMTGELALHRSRELNEYREALAQTVAIAERMSALSDDLLFLASGDNHPRLGIPVELSPLVLAAVHDIRPVIEGKGLALELDLTASPWLPDADPASLRRLVTALLDNAQKYTPATGRIAVSLRETSGVVELSVSDTGCGIPEQSLKNVFDRFYRSDPSRTRGTGGYGLGLAIAQQIALAHGGILEVTSALGVGSTFTLRLPKVPALPGA